MQAIQSRYLPCTNNRGSRIKAWCERGAITIPYPHELSGDACHRAAVEALLAKFAKEDVEKYGGKESDHHWYIRGGRGNGYVTGQLPSGDYAHVIIV